MLNNKDWETKCKGFSEIERVLEEADFFIQSDDLNDLFGVIVLCLKDTNRNIVKAALLSIAKLIESLGNGGK
jgi:hypothetical protein